MPQTKTMLPERIHRKKSQDKNLLLLHENPTLQRKSLYVFPEKELCGLSPDFHIHVSVSDLHIPRIGPHISCSRIGKPIVGIYKSLTDT